MCVRVYTSMTGHYKKQKAFNHDGGCLSHHFYVEYSNILP